MYIMKIEIGTFVLLKSFNGKLFSGREKNTQNDYWKLIKLKGKVIEIDGLKNKI